MAPDAKQFPPTTQRTNSSHHVGLFRRDPLALSSFTREPRQPRETRIELHPAARRRIRVPKGACMSKVWLITGSSRGLGRELARAVLDAGHRLVATARKVDDLRDLAARYEGAVRPVALDVTDAAA